GAQARSPMRHLVRRPVRGGGRRVAGRHSPRCTQPHGFVMRELILAAYFPQDGAVQRLVQRRQCVVLAKRSYPSKQLERAASPEHSRRNQQRPRGRAEPGQTSPKQVTNTRAEETVARGIREDSRLKLECPGAIFPR